MEEAACTWVSTFMKVNSSNKTFVCMPYRGHNWTFWNFFGALRMITCSASSTCCLITIIELKVLAMVMIDENEEQ